MLNQAAMDKLFYEEYLAQNVDSTRITINFQDCAITKYLIIFFFLLTKTNIALNLRSKNFKKA